MFSLVLYGAAIVLYFVVLKNYELLVWFKNVLFVLFLDLLILDVAGLSVYVPYRATGGPRTILKSSESTAWLHAIVFEHKEFLAFAPPLLVLTALLLVLKLGKDYGEKEFNYARRAVIFSLVVALLFTLVVAAEAVLVTKVAPVS
jgi:hypothetical protein